MHDFIAFEDFLNRTDKARFDDYRATLNRGLQRLVVRAQAHAAGSLFARALESLRALHGNAAALHERAEDEFQKMRRFVLDYYEGQRVATTLVDAAGNNIDCVPIAEQPTVRAARAAGHVLSLERSTAVKLRLRPAALAARASLQRLQRLRDADGDVADVPEGTIPLTRLTLSRFANGGLFETFFRKPGRVAEPSASAAPLAASADANGFVHRYAIAHAPAQAYTGCATFLNVWASDPTPGDMHLSQLWIIRPFAGGVQTVESGWQCYPRYYGPQPVPFVFFNPDNYGRQSGYTVNAAGLGFVQTSRRVTFGSPLAGSAPPTPLPASSPESPLEGFLMQWQLETKGWVLYLQQLDDEEPNEVGFFPAFLYRAGDPQPWNKLDFGGEVASMQNSFQTGKMGSGLLPRPAAEENFRHAALQMLLAQQTEPGQEMDPVDGDTLALDPRDRPAYDIVKGHSTRAGTFVCFGGPGTA